MTKILYIISGRSFRFNSLGRKISEVIDCWKGTVTQLDVICGGDTTHVNQVNIASYGEQGYFNKSYRANKWLAPFVISISELKDVIHDIKMFFILKSKYSQCEHNIIWERSSRLHIAGLIYAKIKGVPYVLEWKDNLVNYRWSFFKVLALFVEASKVKNADFIVVESGILKSLLEKKGISKDKIFVAYNAVNADEFTQSPKLASQIREKLQISLNDTLVGYLGSYAFYHSPQLLVEAANITRHNLSLKYLMVGNGKHYNECIELATKYKLIDKTMFFMDGVKKELVPGVLSELDVTVLPGSTDIICPIKIFEYMSAGKAVLLPDYGCNREIILDKNDGMFFTPLVPEDLAEKILFLSENKEFRNSMASNARKSIIGRFSWENTWGKVLRDILNKIRVDYK